MPRGGARTGAGRPQGAIEAATIAKAEARAFIRTLVRAELEPIVRAQIEHAKGVHYMVLRHGDGTYTRATDVKQLDAALAVGDAAFKIFTQAPNVQAFTALTDRAFDRPTEHHELTGVAGGPLDLVVTRLAAARKRLAGRA
jgi:hypothetical protein